MCCDRKWRLCFTNSHERAAMVLRACDMLKNCTGCFCDRADDQQISDLTTSLAYSGSRLGSSYISLVEDMW